MYVHHCHSPLKKQSPLETEFIMSKSREYGVCKCMSKISIWILSIVLLLGNLFGYLVTSLQFPPHKKTLQDSKSPNLPSPPLWDSSGSSSWRRPILQVAPHKSPEDSWCFSWNNMFMLPNTLPNLRGIARRGVLRLNLGGLAYLKHQKRSPKWHWLWR